MATEFTREWIKFFTGCGIPDEVATTYALIFYENRIQKNMLLDLNKEYLRDMGITVMGDVIAILRYAKVMHKNFVSEKLLSDVVDSPSEKHESQASPKNTISAKRILNHYTRKYSSSNIESLKQVKVIFPNKQNSSTLNSTGKKINVTTSSNKTQLLPQECEPKKSGLEISAPKIRRKIPEVETTYRNKKIETRERSKLIIDQVKKKEAKTVFDRLGESSVSSTTSEVSSANSVLSNTASNKEKSSSVFSRLGEKTSVVSSSSGENTDQNIHDQLPYAGIFKLGNRISSTGNAVTMTNINGQKRNLISSSMRADNEQKISVSGKLDIKKGVSVKERLGLTQESQDEKLILSVENLKLKRGNSTKCNTIKLKETKNLQISDKNSIIQRQNNIRNRLKLQKSEAGKALVSTTTQIQAVPGTTKLKRKLETNANSEGSLSKKVRFGSTTLRLIPPNSPQPAQNINSDYPKLTMIIQNRKKHLGDSILPTGVKITQTEPSYSEKSATTSKISKNFRERLGKPVFNRISKSNPTKKFRSVRDRLG